MTVIRRRSRGFSLVGAMFVLVVLSAISVHMLSVSAVAHSAASGVVAGSRARLAAAAGLEWALDDIVNSGAGSLTCTPPGTVTFALSDAALDGFQVEIGCKAVAVVEGARSYVHYELESTASRGSLGSPGYVRRRIVATAAF